MAMLFYLPTSEKIKRQPQNFTSWKGGKFLVTSNYLLSESDKNAFLDFYSFHKEQFVYFTCKREEHSNKSSVYATNTNVILVDNADSNNFPYRVQLWLNATATVYEVDPEAGTATIDYTIPAEGTLRFALEYVGDGNYVCISYSNGESLNIYVQNGYLVGAYEEENKSSTVTIPIGNIWKPNLVMGQVISFSLTWNTDNEVYLSHNNRVEKFYFAKSLEDTEIQTLQNTYDVILLDVFLPKMIQLFDYAFEDFASISVSDYTISIPNYTFYTKARIGFSARFDSSFIASKNQNGQFLLENVKVSEI